MHEIAPFLYIHYAIEIGKPSNLYVIATPVCATFRNDSGVRVAAQS